MEFTKKERLFLIKQNEILKNQLKIMDGLNLNNSKDILDYSLESLNIENDVLKNGFSHTNYLFSDYIVGEMSVDECKEILDILNMYRELKSSYGQLDPDDKKEIDKPEFFGFDQNTESIQLNFLKFQINILDHYDDLKMNEYNSHTSMLTTYRKQLSEWKKLGGVKKRNFTKEEIKKILSSANID